MLLKKVHTAMQVSAEAYTLRFAPDKPYVYVDDRDHHRIAELFFLSSVHPLNGRDDTLRIGAWEASETPGEIVLSITVESSAWSKKIIRFRCQPQRFVYEIEVEGQGQLCDVHYFGGYYSGHVRWGSGFFYSG